MSKEAKEAIFDRWLEALRSGSYEQTRQVLRKNNAYCCLGVLCDIAGAEWKQLPLADFAGKQLPLADFALPMLDGVYEARFEGEEEIYALPEALKTLLGIDDDTELKLSELNDRGHTFAEIADWLENWREDNER